MSFLFEGKKLATEGPRRKKLENFPNIIVDHKNKKGEE
jgi:hypothetical protein